MFLTVPTELAVWRKQATISVQDEFTGKVLPPDLEASLPLNLNQTFETVRAGLRKSAEIYIQLCGLMERLERRHEGIAADYARFSLALNSLTDASEATYAVDEVSAYNGDIPALNDGLSAIAKRLSTSQNLLEDEAKAWDEGVLEDLKRQRDTLVSMRELFDRKERYAVDNIPQLTKRIATTETKLATLRNKPPAAVKPGEIEKLESAIARDKESIIAQQARGILIKECVKDELVHFKESLFHVSKLQIDWAQERVKYAELMADNWRGLCRDVEVMPLGD